MPAVVDLAAMRDGIIGARRRSAEDQPAEPGRSGHRPFGDGRRVRHAARLPAQRRPRIRAQHRALPVPEVGPERLRQLPRGAAGHRHLPPGQPRVPGADGLDRQGPDGRAGRLSRHAGRHRQPHHDGQRPGRARLGRRRHRGRGGDARPAGLDADPRGRRLQADRQDGRGHHRHRPRAQGRADAAQEGRGEQVRRILRRRASTTCRWPTARPSPTWRRNTARPAASSRSTTRRCATCATPGRDEDRIALVEAYAKANGMWRGAGLRAGLHRHAAARHGRDRARRSPGRSGRRTTRR